MRSQKAIVNASRRNGLIPYLRGERYSNTDHNHAFVAYWSMFLRRNEPILTYRFDIFSTPDHPILLDARPQAREALRRLRYVWYARIPTKREPTLDPTGFYARYGMLLGIGVCLALDTVLAGLVYVIWFR